MSTFKRFSDILAWQKARIITKNIYLITNDGAFRNDFGLRDQVRRSSVSAMANIAEGFGRKGDKSFAHYLDISMGSLFETQSHLYVALDVGYLSQGDFNLLFEECNEIFRMLNTLRAYLKGREGNHS
jgi:four helix bundle protein